MRGLFVSTGGDCMAVALGMLYQLDSDYTHACGISTGGLVAASLARAEGSTRECAQRMYLALQGERTSWRSTLAAAANVVYAYLFRRKLFHPRLPALEGHEWTKTLQVGVYNVSRSRYTTFSHKSEHVPIPTNFFSPVRWKGDVFVDGAVAHVLPVPEITQYWTHTRGDVDILLCYPLHAGEWLDDPAYAYDILWSRMQQDIHILEQFFGAPLEPLNRFGDRTVRFLRSTRCNDVVAASAESIVRMFEQGKLTVRTQLRCI